MLVDYVNHDTSVANFQEVVTADTECSFDDGMQTHRHVRVSIQNGNALLSVTVYRGQDP